MDMKELDAIRQSEDMARLVALTAEAEALKWQLQAKIEKACRIYGNPGERLEDWEKRLDDLELLVQSDEVKAVWHDGNYETSTNVMAFLQFEVRRVRRTIEGHRSAGLATCPKES